MAGPPPPIRMFRLGDAARFHNSRSCSECHGSGRVDLETALLFPARNEVWKAEAECQSAERNLKHARQRLAIAESQICEALGNNLVI